MGHSMHLYVALCVFLISHCDTDCPSVNGGAVFLAVLLAFIYVMFTHVGAQKEPGLLTGLDSFFFHRVSQRVV